MSRENGMVASYAEWVLSFSVEMNAQLFKLEFDWFR
jgi:hypothetical protein